MNMHLKDYIQELFNEANLNELITDSYKRNLSDLTDGSGKTTWRITAHKRFNADRLGVPLGCGTFFCLL